MSSKEKKGSARYRPVFLGLQIRRNDFYTTEPGIANESAPLPELPDGSVGRTFVKDSGRWT